jgi:hypothetical protein
MSNQDRGDRARSLSVDHKRVLDFSIIAFCPAVRASVGIDELRCDADAITAQTRATFQT